MIIRVLEDVWWIGGSPCSGKSTAASIVAASRSVPSYSCDDAFGRHAATIQPPAGQTLRRLTAMAIGDRLAQPIDVQVDDVFRAYREEFPLVVRDLRDFGGVVVAEGAALLPELLAAIGVPPDRAVWIVPTEGFQRRHYRQRAWVHDLLAPVSGAEDAFDRWMSRDASFARLVAAQARELGYRVITVDGTVPAAEIAATVDEMLVRGTGGQQLQSPQPQSQPSQPQQSQLSQPWQP